jgi:CHASE2 domain-containing sensor protein
MITHYFVYRENVGFLNTLYEYEFVPSVDKIAIITIDEDTINTIQSWSFLKMITLPKSVLTDTLEKLQSVGVKGIAMDIIFQNPDPDEEKFATTLQSLPNVVIARMRETGTCRPDADGKYQVCEGIPRSVYVGVSQGLIDVDPRVDRKL